jgi:hypothetical protein
VVPYPKGSGAPREEPLGGFLRAGHVERLAWQEMHNTRGRGGLRLTSVATRARPCWLSRCATRLLGEGYRRLTIDCWLGSALSDLLRRLNTGAHVRSDPSALQVPGDVLREIVTFGTVHTDRFGEAWWTYTFRCCITSCQGGGGWRTLVLM